MMKWSLITELSLSSKIPLVQTGDGAVKVKVIAGEAEFPANLMYAYIRLTLLEFVDNRLIISLHIFYSSYRK